MSTLDSTTQPSGEDARRAARNAGALAAASLFSKGLMFAWVVVLGRWLGTSDYGIYGTVGALATIATVMGSFGMGLIVVRDVSRDPSLAGKYLTATLYMQTALIGIAYLVMNAAAWTIGYSDAIRVFTALTGIGLIVDVYGNMCSDQLLAQERMIVTSVVETLHILLRIGAVAAALLLGYGLFGLYLAGVVAGTARSVAFGVALARTGVRPQLPLDAGIAWPLLVNSSPLAASAVLSLAYQQADKLFSTRLLDEASTGYLTAAFVVITGVIELLNSTVLIATYPVMSRYAGQVFGFIVGKLVFFTVLVTLPVALTLSLFAPEVTLPLFGADFAPTARVLRVLIWYALAAMIVNVFAQGMMVQNRQRQLLVIRAGGLALNLALNLTLLIAFDMDVMGLVYASVTAELVVLALLLATFRQDGLATRRLLGRVARAVVAAALAATAMIVGGWVHFTLGILGGALVYAGGVLFGGVLATDDWDLLHRLVGAMPGGGVIGRYWQREVS